MGKGNAGIFLVLTSPELLLQDSSARTLRARLPSKMEPVEWSTIGPVLSDKGLIPQSVEALINQCSQIFAAPYPGRLDKVNLVSLRHVRGLPDARKSFPVRSPAKAFALAPDQTFRALPVP